MVSESSVDGAGIPPFEAAPDADRRVVGRPRVSPPGAHRRAAHSAAVRRSPSPSRRRPRLRPPDRARRGRPPGRDRQKALLLTAIGLVVVFGGIAIAAATWTAQRIDSTIARVPDAFPSGSRPAPSAAGLTFLVVGRDPVSVTEREGLADSVMLVHVGEGRTKAQVVYLPVSAPVRPGGPTLDQSFSQEGPARLVADVEELTGIRIDHYADVDFTGFRTVTDALGGVDVDVPVPYRNDGYDFPAGRQHLDGDAALAYVRDAGRETEAGSAERQQTMIAALVDRVSEQGLLTDPGRLPRTLDQLARALRVDESLGNAELVQLAWSLRGVSQPDFVRAPLAGTTVQDGQAVTPVDDSRADALWGHLRTDTLAEHLDEFR